VRDVTAGAARRAGVSKRGVIRSGLSNKLLYEYTMNNIKLVSLIVGCSVLSSVMTWLFVKDSYESGYEMIGSISNASIVTLNTKLLQLSDEDEARCHLSKHTNWMVEDLRNIEVPDKYIIGGPGLPVFTESTIEDALAAYDTTEISKFASECKTKVRLF